MNEPKTSQIIQPPLQSGQQTVGTGILHHLNQTDIGQMIEDRGIYFGVWRPLDRLGNRFKEEFNVFAAPQDTRLLSEVKPGKLAPYNNDIKRIAGLSDICGHDGVMLRSDREVYEAVPGRAGNHAALAQWHMPLIELVCGRNIDGNFIQPDNLYAHRNKGALKGTFVDQTVSGYAHAYWTISGQRHNENAVVYFRFCGGSEGYGHKDGYGFSSRPIRAELRLTL